jgi:hypothetical protein
MFLSNLAISWHLLGNFGDYKANASQTPQTTNKRLTNAPKGSERGTEGATKGHNEGD